jgi:putative endonuclease
LLGLLGKRQRLLKDKKLLGRWGERRCERFLKRKGLKTLVRNFSCSSGELDLVMVDRDATIVFVEVKTRADESFGPVESVITVSKRAKAVRAARYFLTMYNIEGRPLRFDVVTIILGQSGRPRIRHYDSAFVP